mmetsp:Transcript_26902/g.69176  ORF Transcript_26902/g.69176 Transcript_26902/m.69176 type:complete len:730 (-) Transcript_26902:954-3143(-)
MKRSFSLVPGVFGKISSQQQQQFPFLLLLLLSTVQLCTARECRDFSPLPPGISPYLHWQHQREVAHFEYEVIVKEAEREHQAQMSVSRLEKVERGNSASLSGINASVSYIPVSSIISGMTQVNGSAKEIMTEIRVQAGATVEKLASVSATVVETSIVMDNISYILSNSTLTTAELASEDASVQALNISIVNASASATSLSSSMALLSDTWTAVLPARGKCNVTEDSSDVGWSSRLPNSCIGKGRESTASVLYNSSFCLEQSSREQCGGTKYKLIDCTKCSQLGGRDGSCVILGNTTAICISTGGVPQPPSDCGGIAANISDFVGVCQIGKNQAFAHITPLRTDRSIGYTSAVSADGRYAAYGERGDSGGKGQVVVVVRSASGETFEDFSTVNADDSEGDDLFGDAIALSQDGSWLFVGAWSHSVAGSLDEGAVYVFKMTNGHYQLQQRIHCPIGSPSAYFGRAIAVDGGGNYLVVGATGPVGAGGNPSSGSAFLFTRSSSLESFSFEEQYATSSLTGTAQMGSAVAYSGTFTIAIGAFGHDNNNGSVLIYQIGSPGSEQQLILHPNASFADGSRFGSVLALSSSASVLVVGASRESNEGGAEAGAVYIYTFSNPEYVFQQRVVDEDSGRHFFGSCVSIGALSKIVVIGASEHDNANGDAAGKVEIWGNYDGVYKKEGTLFGDTGGSYGWFGWSCSLSANGGLLAVGAPMVDLDGVVNAGAAFSFLSSLG